MTGHKGSRDGFVLDATTTTAPFLLARKSRYRTQLEGVDPRRIAGRELIRRPLKAWAAAPIKGMSCKLSDTDGFVDVIPLHGAQKDLPTLDGWVADVFQHARFEKLSRALEHDLVARQ